MSHVLSWPRFPRLSTACVSWWEVGIEECIGSGSGNDRDTRKLGREKTRSPASAAHWYRGCLKGKEVEDDECNDGTSTMGRRGTS